MKIIEIVTIENGAHRNQTYHGVVPSGWAVIPDGLTIENFPFGEVEVAENDGVMTVTKWIPGIVAGAEPKVTVNERITELEESLAEVDEVAIDLYEANLAHATIDAEQDEAIIEIYEMIGGVTNG